MPNNRNRNRNRNRNKRNKNQNANQNKQPTTEEEKPAEQEEAATSSSSSATTTTTTLKAADDHHNDNNANSGNISNGSSAASDSCLTVADAAPAGIAITSDNIDNSNTASVNQPRDLAEDQPVSQPKNTLVQSIETSADCTKEQLEYRGEQQTTDHAEDQLAEQPKQPENQLKEPSKDQSVDQLKDKSAHLTKDQLTHSEDQLPKQPKEPVLVEKEASLLSQLQDQSKAHSEDQSEQQPTVHIVPVIVEKSEEAKDQLIVQPKNHLTDQSVDQPTVHIVPVFVQKDENCINRSEDQSIDQSENQPKDKPKAAVRLIPITLEKQEIGLREVQQRESNAMGAKNSKQQQSELPQEQQQQQQQPELPQQPQQKAPGSPRQAKVIVHRLVREEGDQIDGQQQQHVVAPSQQQQAPNQPLQRSTKVIIHQIRVETDAEERARRGKPTIEEISSTTTTAATTHCNSNNSNNSGTLSPPPRYLVESPSPKNVSSVVQFGKFARDVQIQELELNSDCSSGEFNCNGMQSPVVCEVDSETEATTPVAAKAFSPELPSSSRAEQQEQLRQKRAQKRNALESHFLPQLLSPRYLDGILEENSEAAAGSDHNQAVSRSSSAASNDPAKTRPVVPPKANESFPRSQLDFSRRHKRREEPVALMLETKLLDQPSDLESCTRLQSTLSPQSEDAELVYLSSSASSSVSDLMELELEQAAALAERALIDLDTDASKLINRPDPEERSSSTTTEPVSSSNETETEGECEVETEVDTETETEATVQSSRESTPVNAHPPNEAASPSSSLSSLLSAATPTATATPAATPTATPTPAEAPPTRETTLDEVPPLTLAMLANEFGSNKLANSRSAAPSLSVTREEFVRNMEKVRELIEMTRREENAIDNVNANGNGNENRNELRCETDAESIKKLRLLCTETLASMPYGEQMLEELATVAQNITEQQQQQQQQQQQHASNMPYPLPHLPHIGELQLSLGAKAREDAWLGLPTQADPKLLVCLSPGQRALVEQQSQQQQQQQQQPDQLLDAHEKFVQRRGYHELTVEQVRALDSEQLKLKLEQEQMLKTAAKMRELRKSLTPTSPPPTAAEATATTAATTAPAPQQLSSPVPPPVPVKSAETAAKAKSQAKADDARERGNSNYQKVITSTATSSFENKPRQAAAATAADPQQQSSEQLPYSFGQQQQQQQHSSYTSNNSSHMSSNKSKFPASMESELARMFPSIAQQGDIFDEQRKRYSNIEQSSQQKEVQSKRYSNIETSSFESRKRTENGQVVYDYSNSSREQQEEFPLKQPDETQPKVHHINVRKAVEDEDEVEVNVDVDDCAPPVPPPPATNIMSATKLNGKANTFIDDAQQQQQQQHITESSNSSNNREEQQQINSTVASAKVNNVGSTYEEFRQRAKAAIEALGQPNNSSNSIIGGSNNISQPLDNEKLFKDFDALSQQLNAELQTSRDRREQRDKSASLYDLSRHGQQQLEQLKRQRHAHMQELEQEIERSAKSRQERLASVPRSTEIPDYAARSRRAESLCNLSAAEQDDWSRYASDLGYSENIARPFAREVEICYQRQRQPHAIRAPRLSVSTNDLSSSSYDSCNAYGGARRHAPMLPQAPQQQQRPHYASCYSMIERDPNPTYISTTSRRGVSPAPPLQPPAYDRQQRRASLPRELHEQQLQYILSKEEQLKLEFERLQQERRRLMDEMQRAPTVLQAPPPRRESYRPAPKLPTLSEDEVFRQQMAEEWMHKVAEREERRQHKIIKISKIEDEQPHATEEQANISDEFLHRVKQRRHKLAMPADSDWESGAESQPMQQPKAAGSESDAEAPPMRVLEGQAEANLRELPRHLREFAKFSTCEQLDGGQGQVERHEEQERSEMATDNSHCSASKKSTIVKTYKVSRLPPSVQAIAIKTERPRQQQQEQQQQQAATPAATPTSTPTMTAKLRIRPQKQTRFLLSPQQLQRQRQRRSWSESDLLKEIDNELQLAKGFLFANVYKVKHEYMSEPETESDRPRKMAQLGRRQYEGIGPVTNDGMPIILRSEVQEPHQHEWYKRLYQTIHKQKNGARPAYKSNGYVSEPEPNYDSDYSTLKYRTPNPLRVQSVSSAVNVRNLNQDDKLYGTMPNPIKSAQNSYKNQPGRIENYTTGHSSVSEKEKKEWWDEVMDIFNGNLEQSKLSPLYTEGNLSRALAKESGYTSDSNLVFRKKELPVSSPLSPVEQRQAYKSLQAGGEPPLLGFRKPAPEKPKDVNIHFKTPSRHEYKQNVSEEELAIRQAEHMQKLYQEERRRKYLQELQDMNSRRHTDNFTPSQKSPIALNRYDDFPTDVTLKSLVGPKTVARALYNFQGQTSKELSFRKGDTIYIRRQIDPNWYEGEHNAMIGLLPASYVEIVSRDGARTPAKRPSEGQARAKYNFQAQSGVELSLNKGELVTLTRRVDGNWFEGKIANRKGIFPVSYVEVLTDIGAEDIAARTTTVISSQSTTNLRPNLDVLRTNINNEFNTLTQNGSQPPNGILKDTRTLHKTDALHVDTSSEPLTYRALYKYRPQNSDELEIFEGDLVHVLEKCDDGWFVGTSQRTGCFGTFPGNYVERA